MIVTRVMTVGHLVPGMPDVYATPMMILHMEMAAGSAIGVSLRQAASVLEWKSTSVLAFTQESSYAGQYRRSRRWCHERSISNGEGWFSRDPVLRDQSAMTLTCQETLPRRALIRSLASFAGVEPDPAPKWGCQRRKRWLIRKTMAPAISMMPLRSSKLMDRDPLKSADSHASRLAAYVPKTHL